MANTQNTETTIGNSSAKGTSSEVSSIERIFGKYANSGFVFFIFLTTIICFVIYFCVFKDKLDSVITSGFLNILVACLTFFITTLPKK